MYSNEMIAKVLGCTVGQLRGQHAKNAAQLSLMLHKAVTTGKKVNGYTSEQLSKMQRNSQRRAFGGE